MVLASVNYALGKRGFIVHKTCKWLIINWARLSDKVQFIVKTDIEDQLRRDNVARKHGKDPSRYPLGGECDRAQWEQVFQRGNLE